MEHRQQFNLTMWPISPFNPLSPWNLSQKFVGTVIQTNYWFLFSLIYYYDHVMPIDISVKWKRSKKLIIENKVEANEWNDKILNKI